MVSQATTTTTPPDLAREYIARTAWKNAVLGSLNIMCKVLAARFIVLVAVTGGISLAWVALNGSDIFKLATLGIYTVFVIGPCVWLASR
jgi:hypothetical protein